MSAEELSQQLESWSKVYNVEGLSKNKVTAIRSGDWTVFVSTVGMNIVGSLYKGVAVNTFGPDPALVVEENNGQLEVDNPDFSRLIGQILYPSAHQDIMPEAGVPEALEEMSGVYVDENIDFGHHGENHFSESEITTGTDGKGNVTEVTGIRLVPESKFNPKSYYIKETKRVEGDWLVEETELSHPYNREEAAELPDDDIYKKPVYVERLEHPYSAIPEGEKGFKNARISITNEAGDRIPVANLSEYLRKAEEFEVHYQGLPLISEGYWVEMEIPDGDRVRVVQIAFDGDYDHRYSSLDIFSMGPNVEDMVTEIWDKGGKYYENLAKTIKTLEKAGKQHDLPKLEDLEQIKVNVLSQLEKAVRSGQLGLNICIEAKSSGGNAMRLKEGLKKLIEIAPGEPKRFSRMTRIIYRDKMEYKDHPKKQKRA